MASPSESWSSRLRKGYSRKPGGGKPRATSNSADEPLGGDPLLPVTRGLWTRRQLHGGVRAASPRPRRLADRHRLVQQPPRLWHVARQNNASPRWSRDSPPSACCRAAAPCCPATSVRRKTAVRCSTRSSRCAPSGPPRSTAATRWMGDRDSGLYVADSLVRFFRDRALFRPTSSPPTITNWRCWLPGLDDVLAVTQELRARGPRIRF